MNKIKTNYLSLSNHCYVNA